MIVVISGRQLAPRVHGMGIVCCRLTLAIVETLAGLAFIVASGFLELDREYRTFAAAAEWLLIYSVIVFFATMSYDLCQIRNISGKLVLLRKEDTISTMLLSEHKDTN
ncbi:unnamed protein product [Clavelina lepadiformis]|uniref:CWH43-like N-terminal domain-containing protein n=1 Tax=Clavelina lepadiformis TaxID=159417 RepID=A0ABP0FKB5_CLALP